MTVPVWPQSLPQQLLLQGFNDAIGDGRLEVPGETGPQALRLRSSGMVEPLRGQQLMTEAQWQRLREFWALDLIGGTEPFLLPGLAAGEPPFLVRLGAPPSRAPSGGEGEYLVTLQLERLPTGLTAQTEALLAGMHQAGAPQPDWERARLIDRTIRRLIARGIWDKLGLLAVWAAHHDIASLVDWRHPQRVAVPVGGPDFEMDSGWAGDGAGAWLDHGIDWTELPNWQLESASLGVWSLTDSDNAGRDMGAPGTAAVFVNGRTAGGSLQVRLNADSSSTSTVANSLGFYGGIRDGAQQRRFKPAASIFAASTVAATEVPAARVASLRGDTAFSPRRLALSFAGVSLTQTDVNHMQEILGAYLSGVGAL